MGKKIPDLPEPNQQLYNNKTILIFNHILMLSSRTQENGTVLSFVD